MVMMIRGLVSATARTDGLILSQTAIYALKATLCLAEAEAPGRLRVDDIAARLDVPRNYLSKILHTLARHGVLLSARGPRGGFQLARPAADLSLAEVLERIDGLPEESGCLLGRPVCSDANPCAAHDRWKAVSVALKRFFSETSVADLARRTSIVEPSHGATHG
jgi:Rrf2 family protein